MAAGSNPICGRFGLLALRPAHSRRHLYVTCYTEGFSHFVTSMTAPVASGWSVHGWDLHPLEGAAFSRRTQIADVHRWRGGRVLHRDNTLCIALKVRAGARLSCDPNFSEGDRGCLHRRLLAVGRSDRRDPFFKGLRFAPASDVTTIADRRVARIDLGQRGLRLRLASARDACLQFRPLVGVRIDGQR